MVVPLVARTVPFAVANVCAAKNARFRLSVMVADLHIGQDMR